MMSGFREAVHVAKKDLSEQRIVLAIHAALVFIAMVTVVFEHSLFFGGTMFVGLVGIIATTLMVQGDSPIRVDAMWRTIPLGPHRVISAKFLAILVGVVAVGAAGQIVAAVSLRVPIGELFWILIKSIAGYGMILLLFIPLAALTRDLKSLLLALVIGTFALQFYEMWISTYATLGSQFSVWTPLASIVGPLALAWPAIDLYRTRNLRRSAAIVIGFVLVSPFSPRLAWLIEQHRRPAPSREITGDTSGRPEITIDSTFGISYFTGLEKTASRVAFLPFTVRNVTPRKWYALANPVAVIESPDGTTRRVLLSKRWFWISRESIELAPGVTWAYPPPAAADRHWSSRDSTWTTMRPAVHARATSSDLAAIIPGAKLRVTGTLEIYDVRTAAKLAEGETYQGVGKRVTFLGTEPWTVAPKVEVRQTEVALDDRPISSLALFDAWRAFGFALVDESSNHALALAEWGSANTGGGLAAPGLDAERRTMTLQFRMDMDQPPPPPEGNWLRASTLLWVLDWTKVGSYPITMEHTFTKP